MRSQLDENKHFLYMNAYDRALDSYKEDCSAKETIKKLIIYGIKAINTKPKEEYPLNAAQDNFTFTDIIKMVMATLTPGEFMNLFPIEKTYDGHKYEWKDYFYTMDYMKTLDPDKPIGEEILNLLWEYQNKDLIFFNIRMMGYLDDMRRLRDQTNVLEEFFNEHIEEQHQDPLNKEWPDYLNFSSSLILDIFHSNNIAINVL